MKILAFSDCHGQLPNITESFDLLLIAGDICPIDNHSYIFQKEWLSNVFVPWINSLPFANTFSKVVFTPGNHDFYFERERPTSIKYQTDIFYPCNSRFIYLRNESYTFEYIENNEVKSIIIFGSPWCHRFGKWAFMCEDERLMAYYSKIPENCDIVLTHDAPYGCSDICYEGNGLHLGNISLRNEVMSKKPKLLIHGHLHTSNHCFEKLGETKVINVSLLNEAYESVFPILEFTEEFDKLECSELNSVYKFPNRNGYNVHLLKTGCDYTLKTDCYYITEHIDEDNSIIGIDPEGGSLLTIGSCWFDFVIENIKCINQEYVFTLKKNELCD